MLPNLRHDQHDLVGGVSSSSSSSSSAARAHAQAVRLGRHVVEARAETGVRDDAEVRKARTRAGLDHVLGRYASAGCDQQSSTTPPVTRATRRLGATNINALPTATATSFDAVLWPHAESVTTRA